MRADRKVWPRLWCVACVVVAGGVTGCTGPPLSIAPSELPNGAAGTFYSATLSADGEGQRTWSVAWGALPPGLSLDSAGGVISGTPSAAGSFSVGITVADSSFPPRVGEATFNLVILEELILDPTLEPARVDEAYVQAFGATGGVPPYTFQLIGLPAGLDFDGSTGTVFGTPLIPDLGIPLEVTVTDGGDPQQSKTEPTVLVVKPRPVSITTTALDAGTVGRPYAASLEATDGLPPYTWTVAAGLLPEGEDLRLNRSTGVISGTPTTAQTAIFTVEVTDSDDPPTSDSREFMIEINP